MTLEKCIHLYGYAYTNPVQISANPRYSCGKAIT